MNSVHDIEGSSAGFGQVGPFHSSPLYLGTTPASPVVHVSQGSRQQHASIGHARQRERERERERERDEAETDRSRSFPTIIAEHWAKELALLERFYHPRMMDGSSEVLSWFKYAHPLLCVASLVRGYTATRLWRQEHHHLPACTTLSLDLRKLRLPGSDARREQRQGKPQPASAYPSCSRSPCSAKTGTTPSWHIPAPE